MKDDFPPQSCGKSLTNCCLAAMGIGWIHKILDCISTFLGKGYVDGVIEADEVFFAESFK